MIKPNKYNMNNNVAKLIMSGMTLFEAEFAIDSISMTSSDTQYFNRVICGKGIIERKILEDCNGIFIIKSNIAIGVLASRVYPVHYN